MSQSPDPNLVTVGTELTLEEAAQLIESNARDLFTEAYLAASVTCCGITMRIVRHPTST